MLTRLVVTSCIIVEKWPVTNIVFITEQPCEQHCSLGAAQHCSQLAVQHCSHLLTTCNRFCVFTVCDSVSDSVNKSPLPCKFFCLIATQALLQTQKISEAQMGIDFFLTDTPVILPNCFGGNLAILLSWSRTMTLLTTVTTRPNVTSTRATRGCISQVPW